MVLGVVAAFDQCVPDLAGVVDRVEEIRSVIVLLGSDDDRPPLPLLIRESGRLALRRKMSWNHKGQPHQQRCGQAEGPMGPRSSMS